MHKDRATPHNHQRADPRRRSSVAVGAVLPQDGREVSLANSRGEGREPVVCQLPHRRLRGEVVRCPVSCSSSTENEAADGVGKDAPPRAPPGDLSRGMPYLALGYLCHGCRCVRCRYIFSRTSIRPRLRLR